MWKSYVASSTLPIGFRSGVVASQATRASGHDCYTQAKWATVRSFFSKFVPVFEGVLLQKYAECCERFWVRLGPACRGPVLVAEAALTPTSGGVLSSAGCGLCV